MWEELRSQEVVIEVSKNIQSSISNTPVQISQYATKSHQILKTFLGGHPRTPLEEGDLPPSSTVPSCLCLQHHKYPGYATVR